MTDFILTGLLTLLKQHSAVPRHLGILLLFVNWAYSSLPNQSKVVYNLYFLDWLLVTTFTFFDKTCTIYLCKDHIFIKRGKINNMVIRCSSSYAPEIAGVHFWIGMWTNNSDAFEQKQKKRGEWRYTVSFSWAHIVWEKRPRAVTWSVDQNVVF